MFIDRVSEKVVSEGRFPSNIILDEGAAELLDEQSGISKPKKERTGRKGGTNESDFKMDQIVFPFVPL